MSLPNRGSSSYYATATSLVEDCTDAANVHTVHLYHVCGHLYCLCTKLGLLGLTFPNYLSYYQQCIGVLYTSSIGVHSLGAEMLSKRFSQSAQYSWLFGIAVSCGSSASNQNPARLRSQDKTDLVCSLATFAHTQHWAKLGSILFTVRVKMSFECFGFGTSCKIHIAVGVYARPFESQRVLVILTHGPVFISS